MHILEVSITIATITTIMNFMKTIIMLSRSCNRAKIVRKTDRESLDTNNFHIGNKSVVSRRQDKSKRVSKKLLMIFAYS